jgi:hypothetical protein
MDPRSVTKMSGDDEYFTNAGTGSVSIANSISQWNLASK